MTPKPESTPHGIRVDLASGGYVEVEPRINLSTCSANDLIFVETLLNHLRHYAAKRRGASQNDTSATEGKG